MCRCHYVSSWGRDSKHGPAAGASNHTNGLRLRQRYLFSYWQWSSTRIVKPKLKQRLIWSLAWTASRSSAIVLLYHISNVWCRNPLGSLHRVCSRALLISIIFTPDGCKPFLLVWRLGPMFTYNIVHQPLPGIPHRSMADDVYNGMFIPKGSVVIANTR